MRQIFVTTFLAVALFLAAGLVVSTHLPPVKAARVDLNVNEEPCSLHDLAGRWGYTYSGFLTAGPSQGPAASAGSFTEDSVGNIKGSQTRSFNGDVENETFVGTVTVSPDCTGAATISVYINGVFERTSVLNTTYVDNKRGVRGIFTTPFTAITVEARRIGSE